MNARVALAVALACSVLAGPLAIDAQQAGKKLPRVGLVMALSESAARSRVDAFNQGLRDVGYIEGRTVTIEYHYLDGRYERLPGVLAELLRTDASVIVAHGTPAALAAKQATSAVPIVMFEVGDPVGMGLVASLAKPGGNLTGVSQLVAQEIYGKQLQVLTEAIPGLSRVALLWNPANPAQLPVVKQADAAARVLGLTLQPLGVHGPNDLEKALLSAIQGHAGALLVSRDALFANHIGQLVELATRHRLPTMFGYGALAEAGGVIGYGPDPSEISRRAAALVGKILKGARPADLPVEQPTKFELVINLKTAKTLGVNMPASLLLRADHVIE